MKGLDSPNVKWQFGCFCPSKSAEFLHVASDSLGNIALQFFSQFLLILQEKTYAKKPSFVAFFC